jgi:hypothetical protein
MNCAMGAPLSKTPPEDHICLMTDPEKTPAKPDPAPEAKPEDVKRERGGPKGPDPTRYGDWERNGRCVDF